MPFTTPGIDGAEFIIVGNFLSSVSWIIVIAINELDRRLLYKWSVDEKSASLTMDPIPYKIKIN